MNLKFIDPKVKEEQITSDLSNLNPDLDKSLINIVYEPFLNISDYNIIVILTEWDEFIRYDWEKVYNGIKKPACIFDGRNILKSELIKKIGFKYFSLGRK